jgi:hypothetical protein
MEGGIQNGCGAKLSIMPYRHPLKTTVTKTKKLLIV